MSYFKKEIKFLELENFLQIKITCFFQLEMYKMTAFPIVEKVLEGYNGTIFAYGQTGTGKTYTMVGNHLVPELKGIVPNTFSHIFSQISRASEEKSFVVKVTYLEIYNEEVRDLLAQNPTKKLAIRERKDIGVYVKDLMGFTVDSIQAVTELINRGNKNRITRSTLMNDVSSRSHAIFTVTIESRNRRDNKTTVGKLNLVDLAVSKEYLKMNDYSLLNIFRVLKELPELKPQVKG